ncbi:MAG: S-adenosylmethionine:tRNA ribosyltransferase-isomerase [Bacteroidales bacterium]
MLMIPEIRIADYIYELPEGRIAQYPLEKRDESRLLVYKAGKISDDKFYSLPSWLQPNSLLIFNNTRVIKARLLFRKESGAAIEIFCLEPFDPSDYALTFSSPVPVVWKCLAGNLRRWRSGPVYLKFHLGGKEHVLKAEKLGAENKDLLVRFSWDVPGMVFSEVLEAAGHVPLPPYIGRSDEPSDIGRYQTIYSDINGSVAAPTAGLHFTPTVFESLAKSDISVDYLTLHVGAGTFLPVKSELISSHEMHAEHFQVSSGTIRNLLAKRGSVIAVGTTSARTLESLYWLGIKLLRDPVQDYGEFFIDQWDPYKEQVDVPIEKALGCLLDFMNKKGLDSINASTRLIIVPGYRFRVVSGLVTNFHQPGSTLLLLVSAFTGQNWKVIYEHALKNGYRFLSYGDSSLLI